MATQSSYTVTLLVNQNKQGIPGLRVEAWDKDLIFDDLVGSAVTNKDGKAEFTFDKKYFSELFVDRKPDLYFKIFFKERLLFSTEKAVTWNVSSRTKMITVELPDAVRLPPALLLLPPDGINEYSVSGTVTGTNGAPARNYRVMAVDVDLKGAAVYRKVTQHQELLGEGFEYLGEAITDSNGNYSIRFTVEQYAKAERSRADVVVYAIAEPRITGRSHLVLSRDYSAAGQVTGVDIALFQADERTEYDRLMSRLLPFLDESGVGLADIAMSAEQVAFVAEELEESPGKIQLAADAEIMRKVPGAQSLSHELLYGIGRVVLVLNGQVLYKKTEQELRSAISTATAQKIIAEFGEQEIAAFLALLQTGSVSAMLDHKKNGAGATLDQVLANALPDRKQREAFAQAYRNFKGDYADFWKTYLPGINEFKGKPALIDSLLLTQQLALISGNHNPLITELQVNRKITSPVQLLALEPTEWETILGKTGVPAFVQGKDEKQRAQNYAGQINGLLNATFPTRKIAMMLDKQELPVSDEQLRGAVATFMHATPGFDISASRVYDFEDEIAKIAPGKAAEVSGELKRMQRVYQVSTMPGTMSILLENGLDSAYAINSIPQKTFVAMFSESMGEMEAEAVYQRASFMSVRSNEQAVKMMDTAGKDAPGTVLSASQRDEVMRVLNNHVPNYSELFGSPGTCECEHCRSVYSAAAYLVDQLRFLWRGQKNANAKSPLDMFAKRRPDLLHLPLTCENTNTVIPYIDLVNEVMEYYTIHSQLDKDAARDTGDTTAAELRANPQYFELEAYCILKDSVYPFSLPYHQPLDVIRTYSDHLNASRADVMQAMRKAAVSQTEVRAIEAESLSMAEEEYLVLTRHEFDGTNDATPLHEYFGYNNAGDIEKMAGTGVSDGIHEFLRRSGVSYKELVELVKTKFINPGQFALEYLEQVFPGSALTPGDIYNKLKSISQNNPADNDIKAVLNAAGIPVADFETWVRANFAAFDDVITLYQAGSACDLDSTYLRTVKNVYAAVNQSGITNNTWSKMHRFIRLWRKLKWKIEEVDLMLSALGQNDITPSTITKLTFVAGLAKKLKLPVNQLATFWGNIETYGEKSLYKKLFLNKAVQRIDPAFQPDKLGRYLADPTQKLKNHIPGILAAFRMSEEDLQAILGSARVKDGALRAIVLKNDANPDTEDKLDIGILSTIYRYIVLSKALKLKVTDFCQLVGLFAATPFSNWDIANKSYENIFPSATGDFVETASQVKASGFKAELLQYIFSGSLPAESSLKLDAEKIRQAARAIYGEFATIDQNYPDEPTVPLTTEVLRNQLLLSFTAETVGQLIEAIEAKQTFSIVTDAIAGLTIPAPHSTKYSYNDAEGTLACTGIMTGDERVALRAIVAATDDFKAGVDALFMLTNDHINACTLRSLPVTANLILSIPPALQQKYEYIKSGRLTLKGVMTTSEQTVLKGLGGADTVFKDAVDALYQMPEDLVRENFAGLFDPGGSNPAAVDSAVETLLYRPDTPPEPELGAKLLLLYEKYVPLLRKKLRRDSITQHIAALVRLDEETTAVLIGEDIDGIIGSLAKSGLSASSTTNMAFSRIDETVDFSWGAGSPAAVLPADNFNVNWEAYLCPPSSGDYALVVRVKEQDEAFRLFLDGVQVLKKDPNVGDVCGEATVALNAASMHHVRLEYTEAVDNAGVTLAWKTSTTAEEVIPPRATFPALQINEFVQTVTTFHRAAKFIAGFRLDAKEVNHLSRYDANFAGIDFKALTAVHWARVNDYVQLRNVVPQTQATLLDVFTLAGKSNPAPVTGDLVALLGLATAWDGKALTELVAHFGYTVPDFRNEIAPAKLHKCIQLVARTGVDVATLIKWADPDPDFDKLAAMAQLVKSTLKAKYEENDWLEIAGRLSDKIRQNQKQALISHLLTKDELQEWGATDGDGLFEYFLIDVQMGSCMDTSRVVQANSSVQMFVNRCFLNLESDLATGFQKGVAPDALDVKRWEWMKYYRVWEANRKVFLYPENWLEPEWRDDRSPFFKELESELVQNDITTRSVETAFRNYLGKLNEVSNLDVCGTYLEKDGQGKAALFHVIGRTHTVPYSFYYRTWNRFRKWSAWEKIPVDIRGVEAGGLSGVHVIPVVWKNRIFLFWPEFLEKHEEKNNDLTTVSGAAGKTLGELEAIRYYEMRLSWTERVDGKWAPKQMTKEFVRVNTYGPSELNFRTEFQSNGLAVRPYVKILSCGPSYERPLDYFKFSDIQAKVQVIGVGEVSYNLTFDSELDYFNNYQKHHTLDKLQYWGYTYLDEFTDHSTIFSNNSPAKEEYPKDPFFYHDVHRTYFVRPYDTTLTSAVKDPGKFAPPVIDIIDDSYRPFPKPGPVGPDDFIPVDELDILPGGGFTDPVPWKFQWGAMNKGQGGVMNPVVNERAGTAMDVNVRGFARGAGGVKRSTTAQPMFMMSSVKSSSGGDSFPGEEEGQQAYMYKNGNGNMAGYVYVGNAFGNVTGWWNGIYSPVDVPVTGFEFYTFYHPYSSKFLTNLNVGGVTALMDSDTKPGKNDNGSTFTNNYKPNYPKLVLKAPVTNEYKPGEAYTYYKENICFDVYGSNSLYNWEIFFHAPLYIATRLSKNGKYEEAMKWFHYIFDPTTDEMPPAGQDENARFWKVLPFKTTPAEMLEEWFRNNVQANNNPNAENAVIGEWRDNPFKPHLVARNRPLSYMKNVVIKYVENLLAWGDSLFRIDTMETVNEALQIYVIASHILGRRPQPVPKRGLVKAQTYHSLKNKWDDFSNALVELENIFPYSSSIPVGDSGSGTSLLGIGETLYFCIPGNEKLLGHWDTVADRLFKIRHCMNIDGMERKLALFAPAIDPAALINAAAQGLSLGSILADLSSPPPLYRFSYLLQKANEFCSEVKALGSSLLAALEKKDGEELGRLRASHETMMVGLMQEIKERQVLEARSNRAGLVKNRETAAMRLAYYNAMLGNADVTVADVPTIDVDIDSESSLPADTSVPKLVPDVDTTLVQGGERGVKIIPKEKEDLDKSRSAMISQQVATGLESAAGVAHFFPNASISGQPFGIGGQVTFGGSNVGSAISAAAKIPQIVGAVYAFEAGQAGKMASFIRREQDWTLQANLAAREIVQLDKQITSADIRVQIAEKELANHKQQIENTKEVEQFLKDKFSNQELYQWMKEQLFAVYKQSYNMAYDMAKKAEKCYRFETGNEITNFIQYGYWDNTQQGLCSGEKLQLALRQLEKSFIEENRRDLELTKNVSLAMLNPLALQQLRTTGKCTLSVPEELFDMDYQGHYFRRIKSVSLSIPCIAGPYTTVSCSLRLLKNSVRINTSMNEEGNYEHANDQGIFIDDDRFRSSNIPVKAIATSTAQRDSGLFELNFRDERYLPFEGAGAISEWKIELTADSELRQFDYANISDVIMHMNYTARADGGLFREGAVTYLKNFLTNAAELDAQPLMRMFSLKHDFPTEWYRFLHPVVANAEQVLSMKLTPDHFPFFTKDRNIVVKKIDFLIDGKQAGDYKLVFSVTDTSPALVDSDEISAAESATYGNLRKASITETNGDVDFEQTALFETMKLKVKHHLAGNYKSLGTNPDEVEDVFLVFHYALEA